MRSATAGRVGYNHRVFAAMKSPHCSLPRVIAPAAVVIVPLIAATWVVPPGFPLLLRQLPLCVWAVGATIVADRLLFSNTLGAAVQAVGLTRARGSGPLSALIVSLPMWMFIPLFAWYTGIPVVLRRDWPALLVGVMLVNGVGEEVIHRGFVFGHLRRGRSFRSAATTSALVFAAQHLYLLWTIGWTAGLASVLLAAFLAFPLAFVHERGGNSIVAPALLHTSSNAPMIIFALPDLFVSAALVPHMGVVLASIYSVFLFRKSRALIPPLRVA